MAFIVVSVCNNAHAQYALFNTIGEIFVHDTTYEVLAADTSFGYAGNTYTWTFEDGSTHTGQVVRYPFTNAFPSSSACTLTVTFSTGSTDTYSDYVHCNYVFSCSHQVPDSLGPTIAWYYLPGSAYVLNNVGPDGAEILLWYTGVGDNRLKRNMHVDWGNGRSVFASQVCDSNFSIGGINDTAHAAHYAYGGEYIVTGNYYFSFDTMTCPVYVLDTLVIHVPGPTAQPVFAGAHEAYCYGDTLRIAATDTTGQFHNMYHNVDTAGVNIDAPGRPNWLWPMYMYMAYDPPRSSFSFEWYDPANNHISTDTAFTINHLTMADTGIYKLHVHEELANVDTYFYLHVVVDSGAVTSSIAGTPVVCAASAVTLTGTMAGGFWTSSNAAATVAGGVVTGVAAGNAIISYEVSTGCGTAIDTMEVTVNPLPNAGVISGPATVCEGAIITLTNTTTGGAWASSSTDASVSSGLVTGVTAGTTTISYSVSNSCGIATTTYPVTVLSAAACAAVGVAGATAEKNMVVYPNPTEGAFVVSLPHQSKNITITITDVAGTLIQMIKPTESASEVSVSLDSVPQGAYLVKVEVDGEVYRTKIMKN